MSRERTTANPVEKQTAEQPTNNEQELISHGRTPDTVNALRDIENDELREEPRGRRFADFLASWRKGLAESLLCGPLSGLFITHVTQGLQTTLPYVLAVYMVRDFLVDDGVAEPSEEQVGWLTGILGACFCAAQFLTSYPLGKLSDVWGRKPIIVIGNVSCVIGVVLFGLSKNFWQAALTRLVMGGMNGIIGAEKAMIGESLKPEQQSEAMGYISLTWGLGTLIGPLIGGILSSPCLDGGVLGPEGLLCSKGSVLESNPFLLPCLCAALVSLIALIATAFFLPETLPRVVGEQEQVMYSKLETNDDFVALRKKNSDLRFFEREVEMSTVSEYDMESPKDDSLKLDQTTTSLDSAIADKSALPWYKQKMVLLCLTGYASIAFCYILLDEMIPIFASAPIQEGGLGFSPAELSGPLAFGGVVLMLWLLVGYKWMSKRFGILRTCRMGLWQTIPCALLFPLCSVRYLPALPCMWIAITAKYIAGTNTFTSCLVMVNLVAPKESLGEVNGLGQTMASGVRALGPFLGGLMWASSIRLFNTINENLWGHQFLPFSMVSVFALLTLFVYKDVHINHVA